MTPSQAGSSSDRPGPRDRRVPGHRSRPAHGGSDTQAGPGSCHQARNRALREPFIIVADQIQRDHERRCDPLVVVKRPRCIHRMQPHVRSGTFDRQPVLPNDQPEILAPDIAFELISTAYDINPDITQRAHPRPDHTGIEAQSRQSTRVGTKPEPVRPRADHTEMRHDPLRGAVPRPFQLLGRQPGSRAALNEPQHPPHTEPGFHGRCADCNPNRSRTASAITYRPPTRSASSRPDAINCRTRRSVSPSRAAASLTDMNTT